MNNDPTQQPNTQYPEYQQPVPRYQQPFQTPTPPPPPQPSRKKRGPLFWILVGVFAIVAIGLFNSIVNKEPTTTPTPVTQATSAPTQAPTSAPTKVPTARPKSLDQQIHDLVQDASLIGVKSFKTEYSSSEKLVTVTIDIGDGNLTNNLTVGEIKGNSYKVQHTLWTHLSGKIPEVIMNTFMNVQDQYGNVSNREVASCDLQKATEQRFNWDNLTYDQAWNDYDNKHIASFLTQ